MAVSILVLLGAGSALAQCPDGTPPPCPGTALRRPTPALDRDTWIVVPFTNVSRGTELEWLTDASANLLYLDISKWRDVRVIDDERVADFIRQEIGSHRAGVTFQSAISLAKRAGAGRLVMGDVIRVGPRVRLVGKVFDVRSGQRVRTAQAEAVVSDSIFAAFDHLAHEVLGLAPARQSAGGTVGTTSIAAYQAYLAGVGYVNRWALDSARVKFVEALARDSSFALAHYKLALVLAWEIAGTPEARRHADAAVRLGSTLPPRERSLFAGRVAQEDRRFADACTVFENLIRADSTDVEAWYNLGECTYHDPVVVIDARDSVPRFRGSWNTMLMAFRKTLTLDPTNHLAFQHIEDALLAPDRPGCGLEVGTTTCWPLTAQFEPYWAVVDRMGDSLVTAPTLDYDLFRRRLEDALRSGRRRANLNAALALSREWMAVSTGQYRPLYAYSKILLKMGRVREADSVFRQLRDPHFTGLELGIVEMNRFEMALKLRDFAKARSVADSALPPSSWTYLWEARAATFGHVQFLDASVADVMARRPPWLRRYYQLQIRAVASGVADSLYEYERIVAQNVGTPAVPRGFGTLAPTLYLTDMRERGNRWPGADTMSADPRIRLVSRLALGDTVRFRMELQRFDSLADATADAPENGFALTGALAHLVVNDTAGALRHLRRFRDVTWNRTSAIDVAFPGFKQSLFWARTFLLLGDLSAAQGQRDEAITAYRTFVGIWSTADADLQPIVSRARGALSKLGAPPF